MPVQKGEFKGEAKNREERLRRSRSFLPAFVMKGAESKTWVRCNQAGCKPLSQPFKIFHEVIFFVDIERNIRPFR
jgi:hypothetical protein